MPKRQDAPQLKDVPPARVIAIEHRGAYDQIGQVYRELYAWAQKKKAGIAGPGRTVFLDRPSRGIPESARYMVCLPVSGAVTGDRRVQVKDLPAMTAYVYVYQGSYAQIGAKYTELLAWAAGQQLDIVGPPFEIYVKHPMPDGSVKPSECITEIYLPVEA
jgi:effector-binding domain-containing protein